MFEVGDQVKLTRGEKTGTIVDVDLSCHTPYCVSWHNEIDSIVPIEWHYGYELEIL